MSKLEWVTTRLPSMPSFKTERQLRKLSKRDLAERCWAAWVNYDFASLSGAEALARCWELVEMLEGTRPVDQKLVDSLKAHREHVVTCRLGTCEHEYAALVRAGLETWNDLERRRVADATPDSDSQPPIGPSEIQVVSL
jgi:hypothetical protein